jgi:hypothetical protein
MPDFPSQKLQSKIRDVETANKKLQSAGRNSKARAEAVKEFEASLIPVTDVLRESIREATGEHSGIDKSMEELERNKGKFNKTVQAEEGKSKNESLLGKVWKTICNIASTICKCLEKIFHKLKELGEKVIKALSSEQKTAPEVAVVPEHNKGAPEKESREGHKQKDAHSHNDKHDNPHKGLPSRHERITGLHSKVDRLEEAARGYAQSASAARGK